MTRPGGVSRNLRPSGLSRLAFLVAALAAGSPVLAGRPFATEDAGVIEPGKCELELAQANERARDEASERTRSAQLGCGVGANTQLALAYARNQVGAERWPSVSAVGKTAVRPLADGDLGVALAYSLTAEKLPGRSYRHTVSALNLVGTETRGSTLFHGNLGVTRDRVADDSATTWAFAIEQLGDRLDYGFELFGEDSRAAFVGVALRFAAIPGRLMLDASYAIQTNSGRERHVTIGLKAAF